MRTDLSELRGKRVFVGVSGGVDSAITAALLQRAGAEVTAVFIKGWYPPGMPCSWAQDRRDAMRVAAHMRLPFLTLDASKEYKSGVIDYLLREYKAGRTPNPDIMCNKEVKFGAFHAFTKEQGADAIATGHYARSVHKNIEGTMFAQLIRGVDPEKDQSYFLWAISRDSLSDTYFPLGGMHKRDVRELATQFNLPNAQKRDSQGICFLGNVSIEEFLAQEFGITHGEARTSDDIRVGLHSGVLLSTLGQRVHLEHADPGPWYVVAKDIEANILTVSRQRQNTQRDSFVLTDTNWLSTPLAGAMFNAQYRYHGPRIKGTLTTVDESCWNFTPTEPVTDPVASGQSLVVYDEEECIGGGIIA